MYTLLEWGLPLYLAGLATFSGFFNKMPSDYSERGVNVAATVISGFAAILIVLLGISTTDHNTNLESLHAVFRWIAVYLIIGATYAVLQWADSLLKYRKALLAGIKSYVRENPTKDIFKVGAEVSDLAHHLHETSKTQLILHRLGFGARLESLDGYSRYSSYNCRVKFENLVAAFPVDIAYLLPNFGPNAIFWPMKSVIIMFGFFGKSTLSILHVSKIAEALQYCSQRSVGNIIVEAERYRQSLLEKK